jgi:hypothetical protein
MRHTGSLDIVTVGASVTLAEDLGEISGLALDSNGLYFIIDF